MYFLILLPLLCGCRQEHTLPPFPDEYELMVAQVDSVSWNDWLDHWSAQGPSAMQLELRALRSLIDEWPDSDLGNLRVAWYRISPDRWSVLLGSNQPEGLQMSNWQEQERASYRSVTIQGYRTANNQRIWSARQSGWQLLAFQRSVLQDALLAELLTDPTVSSRMEFPFFTSDDYLVREAGGFGFRQKNASEKTSAFAKKELADLPDFLRKGRSRILPDRDWLPYTDRVVLASGFPLEGNREEVFIWLPDSTQQWDAWWEQNRRDKGELAGFSHQGVRIHQVLDERWQSMFSGPYRDWMPAPFVVRFNDGWILSNSEEGVKRWMDYLLVQKTFEAWLSELAEDSPIAGWNHSGSAYAQRQLAKIGPLLPKGETWFWLLKNNRYFLQGANPPEGQSELLWQSTAIDGPVTFWQFLSNTIWIRDKGSIQQWSTAGSTLWKQPMEGHLLGAIQQSQIGEEITWLAGTDAGLYAWDVQGKPTSGSPFRPSADSFISWTHRLGTNRQLYRFALEANGSIRGIVGRGIPASGWPRQVDGAIGLLALRTDTEDALVTLGAELWKGFTLDGYDRWEINAPGMPRQWVTGPEAGAALVRLADGRLMVLSLTGQIEELATDIDTLVAEPGGQWVFAKQKDAWILWRTEGIGGTYKQVRELASTYFQPSLQSVSEKPWLAHQPLNGTWQVLDLNSETEIPQLPGHIAPLVWRRGRDLIVLTGQEDKVVAYQFTPD